MDSETQAPGLSSLSALPPSTFVQSALTICGASKAVICDREAGPLHMWKYQPSLGAASGGPIGGQQQWQPMGSEACC